MKHKFNQIEIRIEKIFDQEENIVYYWSYALVGDEVTLIGKSKSAPPVLNYDVTVS